MKTLATLITTVSHCDVTVLAEYLNAASLVLACFLSVQSAWKIQLRACKGERDRGDNSGDRDNINDEGQT